MISKFKLRVVGDGIEIVVAVDQAGQTLLDDVEERVERRECRVLGIGHDLKSFNPVYRRATAMVI
jgi:hypothetical protein